MNAWQPIATAPKKIGSRFLVFADSHGNGLLSYEKKHWKAIYMAWNTKRWSADDDEPEIKEVREKLGPKLIIDDGMGVTSKATHWMPLPKPPK